MCQDGTVFAHRGVYAERRHEISAGGDIDIVGSRLPGVCNGGTLQRILQAGRAFHSILCAIKGEGRTVICFGSVTGADGDCLFCNLQGAFRLCNVIVGGIRSFIQSVGEGIVAFTNQRLAAGHGALDALAFRETVACDGRRQSPRCF